MSQAYPHLDWETLACGCKIATDPATKSFLMEPCSMDCEYYQYAVAETKRQGKPMLTERHP